MVTMVVSSRTDKNPSLQPPVTSARVSLQYLAINDGYAVPRQKDIGSDSTAELHPIFGRIDVIDVAPGGRHDVDVKGKMMSLPRLLPRRAGCHQLVLQVIAVKR